MQEYTKQSKLLQIYFEKNSPSDNTNNNSK